MAMPFQIEAHPILGGVRLHVPSRWYAVSRPKTTTDKVAHD